MEEREAGGRPPPAHDDERRLLAALLAAPTDAQLAALLRRVTTGGASTPSASSATWPCDAQANLRLWGRALERLQQLLQAARDACPRLVLVENDGHPVRDACDSNDKEEEERTEHVYEALRFSALLLQNATNKHVYKSVEVRAMWYWAGYWRMKLTIIVCVYACSA